MTPNDLSAILGIGLIVAGGIAGASPIIANLPIVKKRPGLANFITGAGNFAGRVKHLIPEGSTPAQAEAVIVAQLPALTTEYAESIAKAKLSPAEVKNTAVSKVLDALPAGHLIADALPALVTAEPQIQSVIAQLNDLLAKHAPVVAVPVEPVIPPVAAHAAAA